MHVSSSLKKKISEENTPASLLQSINCLFFKKIKISNLKAQFFLSWLLLAVPALLLAQLIPPFQSPDENSHLARADMLAHGQLFLKPAPQGAPASLGGSGGDIDMHLALFAFHATSQVHTSPNVLFFQILEDQANQLSWAQKTHFFPSSGTGYYFPAIYLPHAAALWIGRKMGFSVGHSYYLLRTVTTSLCLGIIVLAWRAKKFNLLTIGILTTPMTLFQIISPTIDGLTICIAIYLVALFFIQIENPRKNKSSHQIAIIFICIFFLATSRTNLLPTLFIPLYLAWHHRSHKILYATIILSTTCLGWTAFALASTVDTRIPREFSTSQIIVFYLKEPWEFFSSLYKTLSDSETRFFYQLSFVGFLGWLDTPIKILNLKVLSYLLLFMALFSVRKNIAPNNSSNAVRILLILIGASGLFLIFFALAVTWNTYPAKIITGVQGRYFIIPTLFFAAALGPSQLKSNNFLIRSTATATSIFFIFYSIFTLSDALANRYFLLPY